MRLELPLEGEIELPSDDVSVHAIPLATVIDNVVVSPVAIATGPVSPAKGACVRLTIATDSMPAPQDVVARPEYAALAVAVIARLPEAGNAVPMLSIETRAVGSDAAHDTVTVSPEQALVREDVIDSVGFVQLFAPIPAARRFDGGGGICGWNGGVKSIDVTG